ncbi:MAG: SDR family NAD(P)-dependent oxidoreductase, partial [Anaerolineales bacterium]|nr:SDR family NAD(P)-dependent oxidoreductase [Anaerolineales bacterium]
MSQFSDKVALVTGSGRGIGREIALKLAREGAHVIVNFFRNREPAEETAVAIRALGRQAMVVKANVGDLDDMARLYADIENTFGGLDILVINAGGNLDRNAIADSDFAGW